MSVLAKLPINAFSAYLDHKDGVAGASAKWLKEQAKLSNALASVVDEKWRPLVLPVAEFAKAESGVAIQIFDAGTTHKASSFGWDWTMGGTAASEFTIDVLDEKEREQHGVTGLAGHEVIRYTLNGELGATLGGAQDVGAWNLRAGVGAKVGAGIDWYFAAASTSKLISAMLRAANSFSPPSSLPDMLQLAGTGYFRGAAARINGSLQASFTAKAAYAATGWSWGMDGKPEQIGLSVGVEGSASLKIEGKYRIRVIPKQRGHQWGVQLKLDRIDTSEGALGVKLAMGADFSALAQSAERVARAHLPDATALSAKLDLLTTPGTYLRAELKEKLQARFAKPVLTDFVLLVAGAGNQRELAQSLAERAVAPLTDLLDRAAGEAAKGKTELKKRAKEIVAEWTDKVFGELPIAQFQTALEDAVLECIDSVATEVTGAIGELASKIETEGLKGATKLLTPFAALGELIEKNLKEVGGNIKSATQTIRDAIAVYMAKRKLILDALSSAERAKVTMAIGVSVAETEKKEQVFSAWFGPAEGDALAAAERLFQAVWRGNLSEIGELVREAERVGAVAEVDGWILRALKRVVKESVSISILGWDFSERRVSILDLSIKSDLFGNLLAVAGGASIESEIANAWFNRKAQLAVMVRTGDLTGADKRISFEFAGAFVAGGKKVDAEHLQAVERSLAVLTGDVVPRDFAQLLGAPRDPGEASQFWRTVTLTLPMSLQDAEWRTFCNTPDDVIRRVCCEYGMAALDVAHRDRYPFASEVPSVSLQERARGVIANGSPEAVAVVAEYLGRYRMGLRTAWFDDLSAAELGALGFGPFIQRQRTEARMKFKHFNHLAQLLFGMVTLKRASLDIASIVANANGASAETVYDQSKASIKAMGAALEPAAVASETFTGAGEYAPWPFVTFAASMAKLSGSSVPPGFLATLAREGSGTGPVVLVP